MHITTGTEDGTRLVMTIRDDGRGFDTRQPRTGMGLASMRSRAIEIGAGLAVDAAEGSGCTLKLSVPLIDPAAMRRRVYKRRLLATVLPMSVILLAALAWPDASSYHLARRDCRDRLCRHSGLAAGPPAMTEISIALVDDHRVVTAGLRRFLESFPGVRVVGVADNGEQLLEMLPAWAPDIVVVDLLMPGGDRRSRDDTARARDLPDDAHHRPDGVGRRGTHGSGAARRRQRFREDCGS